MLNLKFKKKIIIIPTPPKPGRDHLLIIVILDCISLICKLTIVIIDSVKLGDI